MSNCHHHLPPASHPASHPGVIGRRMKMENFIPAIPEIVKTLGSSREDGHRASVAITTTGASGWRHRHPAAHAYTLQHTPSSSNGQRFEQPGAVKGLSLAEKNGA